MQKIIKLSAALALLLAPLSHAAESHSIKLVRPYVVGETFTINGDATTTNTTALKVNGNAVPAAPEANSKLFSTLEATKKVLSVDEKGKVETCLLTVKKLTSKASEDADAEKLLDAGTAVSVKVGTKEVQFTIDGKEVTGELAKVLGEFFDPRDDSTDDDDIFGTEEKVAVGDSWKIDSKAAAEGLSKHGMKIGEDGVRGRMKLVGLVTKDGVECLDIRGEIEMVGFAPQLPDGMKLGSSEGRLKLEGLFPIDQSLQPINILAQMEFKMKAERQDAQPAIELTTSGLVKKTEQKKRAQ